LLESGAFRGPALYQRWSMGGDRSNMPVRKYELMINGNLLGAGVFSPKLPALGKLPEISRILTSVVDSPALSDSP